MKERVYLIEIIKDYSIPDPYRNLFSIPDSDSSGEIIGSREYGPVS